MDYCKKSSHRLGARGIDEIKNHSWLEDFDWTMVGCQNIDKDNMPFIPKFKENMNINNVDDNEIKKILLNIYYNTKISDT